MHSCLLHVPLRVQVREDERHRQQAVMSSVMMAQDDTRDTGQLLQQPLEAEAATLNAAPAPLPSSSASAAVHPAVPNTSQRGVPMPARPYAAATAAVAASAGALFRPQCHIL